MKKNLANMITMSRMIGTLVLIFLETLSYQFCLVYVYCGLSDVADGIVARKTHTISALGSKLDSVSDLLFFTVMMFKVKKYLDLYLPFYVWAMIYAVLVLRILCYLAAAYKERSFRSRHTVFNKTTGFCLFFLPFVVKSGILVPFSLMILTISYVAVFEEIVYLFREEKEETAVSGGVK